MKPALVAPVKPGEKAPLAPLLYAAAGSAARWAASCTKACGRTSARSSGLPNWKRNCKR